MRYRVIGLLLVSILAAVTLDRAWGDSKKPAKGARVAERPVPPLPQFTPERESAALTFVRRNHPELIDLLTHLRHNAQAEYQLAVRELFATSEQLTRIQLRSEEEYFDALTTWKLKSRVQLLAAQLASRRDDNVERALRAALAEQIEHQCQRRIAERDRLRQRLDRLDAEIHRMQEEQARIVETRMRRLLRETAATQTQAAKETTVQNEGKEP